MTCRELCVWPITETTGAEETTNCTVDSNIRLLKLTTLLLYHFSLTFLWTSAPVWDIYIYNSELMTLWSMTLFNLSYASCFTTLTVIICVVEFVFTGTVFVSYGLPGNESPPSVINGKKLCNWGVVCTLPQTRPDVAQELSWGVTTHTQITPAHSFSCKERLNSLQASQ